MIGFMSAAPHLIPNCHAHWSARFGVFNGSGTPAANNDAVSSWVDSSSLGHTLTNSGSARPTYIASSNIGSKPALRFNGSQELTISSAADWPTTASTMFIVSSASNTSGTTTAVCHYPDSAGNRYSAHNPWGGVTYWDAGDIGLTGRVSAAYPSGNDVAVVVCLVHSTAIPFQGIYFNGTLAASAAQGSTFSGSGYGWSVGTANRIGGGHVGDIAEVIIYKRVLDSYERGVVTAYLKSAYGLA